MKIPWLPISEDPRIRTELLVDALLPLLKDYDLIIMPAYAGVLPASFAAKAGGTAMTLVCGAEETPNGLLIRRKVYGGHIMGEFLLDRPPYFVSLDRSITEPASLPGGLGKLAVDIDTSSLVFYAYTVFNADAADNAKAAFDADAVFNAKAGFNADAVDPLQGADRSVEPLQTSSGLSDAKVVVAVGRGMRSKAGLEQAQALADALGAALGGSRPVIMNAWLPKEKLIGVSGEMISPNLCLVLAASGSPAFYAGIEGSKTIIAINDDPSAPIMKKADACICADWKSIASELLKLL